MITRKELEGVLIGRVSLARVEAKTKLGQNRRPEERRRVLERLWGRGGAGDPRAIERVLAANPDTPGPTSLQGPEGVHLLCHVLPEDADAALSLLDGQYWTGDAPQEDHRRAHLASAAWVGAREPGGRFVATARAVSDTVRRATIHDVVVHPDWRGRGLGEAVMRLLLDHPAVRSVSTVRLATRDAQGFYERLGFADVSAAGVHDVSVTEMVLKRAATES